MPIEAVVVDEVPALQGSLVAGIGQLRRPRLDLAGTLIDRVDRAQAVEHIRSFLVSGKPHQIVTVNLDFLSIASSDPRFQQTINESDLAVPDGMPVLWLSRLKREPLLERVTGVDLVHDSCAIAAQTGRGAFLIGA